MSNNSFNPVQFGAALSRIVSHLGDANFIDSIAPEIAADSIESALSILESRLHYFSSCNFHPISAQITRILAFAYHIRNEPEKFVTYGFRCISPLYQRFLPTDSQIKFLEVLPNCPSVEVDVTQSSSVPFDILAGFEDEKSYPSDDVEFGFSIRSLLEYEISIDSISIAINHNKEGISSYKVLDTQVIKKHQKIKELIKLPIHKPGRISINSISIKIYNVVLNVKIFKQMGYNESVINPFDDECKFEIVHPELGVTNVDYPINIKCDNIPDGADSFTVEANINNEQSNAKFVDSNSLEFKKVYEKPSKLITETLKIRVPDPSNVQINIRWSLLHDTVSAPHNESISIQFRNSFTMNFKFFGPDRHPIKYNSRTTPELSPGEDYILVSNFEYNLTAQSTVTKLQLIPSDKLEIEQFAFDLPIDILTAEAFSSVCKFRLTNESESGSLGKYILQYRINNSSDDLILEINLPIINVIKNSLPSDETTSQP